VLGQELNLNISSSFSQMILLAKLLPRQICMQRKNTEGDSTNKILNVALMEGCFVRRNEGVLWCDTEHGSEFEGAVS
jgi:hypothetical protein